MQKRRKPTVAMGDADEKRIAKARTIMDAAFQAALIGCSADMGCGTWIDRHASEPLREAYRTAHAGVTAAEQAAIDRGTMYRGTYGMVQRIRW